MQHKHVKRRHVAVAYFGYPRRRSAKSAIILWFIVISILASISLSIYLQFLLSMPGK